MTTILRELIARKVKYNKETNLGKSRKSTESLKLMLGIRISFFKSPKKVLSVMGVEG